VRIIGSKKFYGINTQMVHANSELHFNVTHSLSRFTILSTISIKF